ncbi:amino acid ABC transporter permease [Brevibacillus daliensis]|uniref:amino acid ABC transporter permease n=1 Tax=Brevibacillus daliensis TaxID=2892995 RepID=UPI001E5474BA|nr:amino acid ABC transporter permease [Brevibacillus daliensis]
MGWGVIIEYKSMFINGFINTIILTIVAIIFGTILGLILGLGKMSTRAYFRIPCSVYVEVFRGTPLFVQILSIHTVLIPGIWQTFLPNADTPSAMFTGFVALSLNAGAYIAEIFRAGIQSIDKGQMEAARSLGLTHAQSMKLVILPQAFTRMLPPLGNEFIALLKDSSLLAAIATPELGYAAMTVAKNTWERLPAFGTAAIAYLILTLFLSKIVVRKLEQKYTPR